MGTIFCDKCGKETDSSGRFCQWCGSNCEKSNSMGGLTFYSPVSPKTIRDNVNGDDKKDDITFFDVFKGVAIFAFFITFMFLLLYLIPLAFQTTTVITNITITEKYPAHSYSSGKSTSINHPSVVDETGEVYGVSDQQLWGKLRINSTYTIRYFETGGTYPKTIDGAIIDGVSYIFK